MRVTSATLPFFSQGQGLLILGPTEVSAKAGLEVGLRLHGEKDEALPLSGVPLVLFQSYFGTFWKKNNKMTVTTQAAEFSRLLYIYLTARK